MGQRQTAVIGQAQPRARARNPAWVIRGLRAVAPIGLVAWTNLAADRATTSSKMVDLVSMAQSDPAAATARSTVLQQLRSCDLHPKPKT